MSQARPVRLNPLQLNPSRHSHRGHSSASPQSNKNHKNHRNNTITRKNEKTQICSRHMQAPHHACPFGDCCSYIHPDLSTFRDPFTKECAHIIYIDSVSMQNFRSNEEAVMLFQQFGTVVKYLPSNKGLRIQYANEGTPKCSAASAAVSVNGHPMDIWGSRIFVTDSTSEQGTTDLLNGKVSYPPKALREWQDVYPTRFVQFDSMVDDGDLKLSLLQSGLCAVEPEIYHDGDRKIVVLADYAQAAQTILLINRQQRACASAFCSHIPESATLAVPENYDPNLDWA